MTDFKSPDPQGALALNGLVGRTFGVLPEDGDAGAAIKVFIERAVGDGMLAVQDLRTGGPFQIPVPGMPGARTLPDGLFFERGLSEERIFEIHAVDDALFAPEHDDDEARAADPMSEDRLAVIKELIKRNVGSEDLRLSRTITSIWKDLGFDKKHGQRPETKTVRSWLSKRNDPETITMGDLVSRSSRVPRALRVHPKAVPVLDDCSGYFFEEQGLRVADCLARMARQINALNQGLALDHPDYVPRPSRETLRRRIAVKLTRETYARKYGETAAKKNFDGAGNGLTAVRIGELGVMDDTVFDSVACFDAERGLPAGRPYLCVLLDVKSRCIVGYLLSFEPPTAHTALETIRAANRLKRIPKDLLARYPVLERINCKFEEIVVDRGSNYTSHAFGQALLDVGTTLRFARVRHARDKAIVERLFYTIKTFIIEKLPGATFAPKLMREFGYDPEKVACLTVSELREIIEHFIAVYHITVHGGIGRQPALAWSTSLEAHGRHVITNPRKLGILTGETVYGVRLDRQGFIVDGIRYTHETNVALALDVLGGAQAAYAEDDFEAAPNTDRPRKRRKARAAGLGDDPAWATIKIKRNTANLLRVHAYVPDHGWLEFEAANAAYADGLSLYQHKKIGEWAKARNLAFSTEEEQLVARDALIEHVREMAPNMSTRERRAVARMTGDGAPDMSEVDHQFAEPSPSGRSGEIESEPCDDRDDALIDPAAPKKRGKGGKAKEKSSTDQDEAAALLAAVRALGWDSPTDEDEVMEEHR